MNDYTPVAIEVTNTFGKTEVYRSKFLTCKELGIQMTSLQSFLKQPTVTRGRFKGWRFSVVS
jgi:hypothetical protein